MVPFLVLSVTCTLFTKPFAELMGTLREDLVQGSQYVIASDAETFLWVLGFFTAFHSYLYSVRLLEWQKRQNSADSQTADGMLCFNCKK